MYTYASSKRSLCSSSPTLLKRSICFAAVVCIYDVMSVLDSNLNQKPRTCDLQLVTILYLLQQAGSFEHAKAFETTKIDTKYSVVYLHAIRTRVNEEFVQGIFKGYVARDEC